MTFWPSSQVFAITATFCVFAYLWLIIILVVITPDFVDLWEAMVTLLFFPLLVLLAYMADKEFCCTKTQGQEEDETEFGLGRYKHNFTLSCLCAYVCL